MQNKGLIKLIAICLAIASAYQLSFSFVTRHYEKKAAEYALQFSAEEQSAKQQYFLDSIKSQKIYLGMTYKQVKDREINLGLDLKGGMNVMLEISVEDVVRALSDYSTDPEFNNALESARIAMKTNTEDFITLFAREYARISGNKQLALIFNTQDLRSVITPTSTNDEVVKVLRERAESAIANSYNVLRSRIDRFGVTQPNVQRIGSTGRILVELPGVKEPERVRKLLQGTASLEFWTVYNNQEVLAMLNNANTIIRDLNNASEQIDRSAGTAADNAEAVSGIAPEDIAGQPEQETAEGEAAADEDILSQLEQAGGDEMSAPVSDDIYARENPLFSKLIPMLNQTGQAMETPVVGIAMPYDTAAINKYLSLPQVQMTLPRDLKFMWGAKASEKYGVGEVIELYAIRTNRDGKAPLDGAAVADARAQYTDQGSNAEVSMTMTPDGSRTWARLTADNIGSYIAIVLDGYVYSAPGVSVEITGGRSSITGNFDIQEATDLANVLKSGKLPAPARITQEAVVGPSLGQESINSSMISFVLAFCMVLVYMMIFYNRAGWVASMALVTNLFFLFGALVSFGVVLTLPGIAGIVLTMGMAVDANVLIYERVKEELRSGKGLSLAVSEGYKNAMSAILDSNITSIIVGIVLFFFGTGPVQGFASTFIIGILTSLFTSILITRIIFDGRLKKGKNVTFFNKWSENFLANTKVNFIGIRKYTYIISIGLVLIAVFGLTMRGLNYGVDFSGGRTFVVRFDKVVSVNEVRSALEEVMKNAEGDDSSKSIEVKQFGAESQRQMRIVTQYMHDDMSQNATNEVERLLFEALAPLYEQSLTFDEFQTTTTNPNGIISADMVGPTVANDITRNSFIAVFFSLFAMGIYIILRFKKWQWGAGTVCALAQDAFLTLGVFSLFHGVLPFNMEIDQAFIAAILTIIAYSINDKVVIFDRIREYTKLFPKRNMRDNINYAVNSTLARTVNTSGSTLLVLLAIFLFGGEVIRGFVFAIMFGIFLGTLSSVFTATPLAYDMMPKNLRDKDGAEPSTSKK